MRFNEIVDTAALDVLGTPAGRIGPMDSEDTLRLAGITQDSITDGPGIRLALFAQGCPHRCPGCHNPQTHPFSGGRLLTLGEITKLLSQNPLYAGVTFSGGEPFLQAKILAKLAAHVKTAGGTVITYTGYTLDQLKVRGEDARLLLSKTDLLIDGRYEASLRSLELPYRGSKNQRLLLRI